MRLHLLAFPHTRVDPSYSTCAYTMKIWKFLKMMHGHHEIVLYAPEGSDARGHELVEIISDAERVAIFGRDDPNALPAWPTDQQAALFNARAAVAVRDRVGDRDMLLMTMGLSQKPVHDALADLIGADRKVLACEPGVGYEGWFTNHVSFESYAWMHWLYAKKEAFGGGIQDGRFFDAVIPNYFDTADFAVRKRAGSYLLFLGRLINRKGAVEANTIANELDMPLVVAGPGILDHRPGFIRSAEVEIRGANLSYAGVVGIKERADLLAGATALLVPTRYVEPFGGVAVEAMMAGCPVVATPWGAFTETVVPGVSGYHFHNLAEGCDAVERAALLKPQKVRAFARGRYSLEAVAPMFDRWFDQLATLWDAGWYTRRPIASPTWLPTRSSTGPKPNSRTSTAPARTSTRSASRMA